MGKLEIRKREALLFRQKRNKIIYLLLIYEKMESTKTRKIASKFFFVVVSFLKLIDDDQISLFRVILIIIVATIDIIFIHYLPIFARYLFVSLSLSLSISLSLLTIVFVFDCSRNGYRFNFVT